MKQSLWHTSRAFMEYCECSTEMTNEHLLFCNFLNEKSHIYTYDDFLNGNLIKKKDILNILRNNMEKTFKFLPGTG